MAKVAREWGVAKAKARFSELLDRALNEGPQAVKRNGRDAVVVVSAEEWERRTRRMGSLADFFASSPLAGSRIRAGRSRTKARETGL